MGGFVPLGYDVRDRKLIINKTEAASVRTIFERFASIGSMTKLIPTLAKEGIKAKSGKPADKGYLYRVISNRIYIGEAVHKGKSYPGEHKPIIDRNLWDRVHAILTESPRKRAMQTRAQTSALLKGLLFAPDGTAMTPTHTRRKGKLYRYYVSVRVLKQAAVDCSVRRVPAGEIEAAVIHQIRALLRAPEIVVQTWRTARRSIEGLSEADVRDALLRFDPMWDELFPAEQARIVQLLVERVDLGTDGADIRLRTEGLTSLVADLRAPKSEPRRAA